MNLQLVYTSHERGSIIYLYFLAAVPAGQINNGLEEQQQLITGFVAANRGTEILTHSPPPLPFMTANKSSASIVAQLACQADAKRENICSK